MQNKGNCGWEQGSCQNAGFVPVNGNWDFNMNGDCGCGYDNRNSRRNRGNNGCKQCERCEDSREVECCEGNTYIRDMDECECRKNQGYNRSSCSGKDDCQCENCVRSRKRDRCGNCEKDCDCSDKKDYNRGRSDNCGCDKDDEGGYSRCRNSRSGCKDGDNGTTYARSKKNRGVGMVKGYKQEIDEIFQSESALRAGTLFPELHKPLNGYCPYDGNCGTCAQAAAFAAWELRLYLNTHPDDEEALKLFRKLCKETEKDNYATTFLKDECCTGSWSWVRNPWPWEFDCKCGD